MRVTQHSIGLEHDPAICGQPPDKHARQNKGLERDASGAAGSNRSRPALVADRVAVTALEYGIIAAFFAVLLVGIFGNFGKTLVTMFSGVTNSI